ncbi:MAG: hypothetical protein C0608_11335 [Deltaproteobacteria bacterium]|nr:MAG: hypothetical protein C0608_11335 [Deltaproteobacteria bacterium]
MEFRARVSEGLNEANFFTELDWVKPQLTSALGREPYPGTLNLTLSKDRLSIKDHWDKVSSSSTVKPAPGFCSAICYPVRVNGLVPAVIVLPEVDDYPADKIELVSPYRLRDLLSLSNGDEISVSLEMRGGDRHLEGVIFDLEGTLVDFQWNLLEAEAELKGALLGLGFDEAILKDVDYAGIRKAAYVKEGFDREAISRIDAALGPIYDKYDHDALDRWSESSGAEELLRKLKENKFPIAMVSNIGREVGDKILDRFQWRGLFDVIITRNDVALMKPDGEGIQKALELMSLSPDKAIMVGDSMSDLKAARASSVKCAIIKGGEKEHRPLKGEKPDLYLESLLDLEGMFISP